ncbi:MAG: acyl-CoA desaturase, partial [Nitrospira sp.]|nr:acyl-CoA desaturase [Nitrospira sp.]
MINPFIRKMRRSMVLAVVVIPFLGLVTAIALLWRYATGPVELGMLVVMYTISMIGVTVGFHRHFAHRAFQANTTVRVILAILGSMALQGRIFFWVSAHRRHHAYSDQPGDPHSPHLYREKILGWLQGLWHAQIGWFFHEFADWT